MTTSPPSADPGADATPVPESAAAGLDPPTAELTALRELRGPLDLEPDEVVEELPPAPAYVTGVLVAHDGETWLPTVLHGLADQTRQLDRIVAVDVASTDGTHDLLVAAVGAEQVVTVARDTGFGAAVAAGLAALAPVETAVPEHVWLLHDDAAPGVTALEELLRTVGTVRNAAAIACKQVDWDDPRVLVEVGLSVDRGGHRYTGLDGRELDQGQHDGTRDVLAASTAGLLVRRDAWDTLGGLDPALPLFRDDIDLGVRIRLSGQRLVVAPSAVMRHARAAATGRRPLAAVIGPPRRADRRHALHVQAVNAGPVVLPIVLVAVVLGALLRAVGDLLTRRPHHARDEIEAVRSLLTGLGRLARGRAWRSGQRRGHRAEVRALLAPPGARLRSRLGAASDLLTGSGELDERPVRLETGPSEEDEGDLLVDDSSRLRALLLRPGLLVPAGLLVVALIAARHLFGTGALTGGRLLPAPAGASDLWASWFATWHPGPAGGTAAPAAPWTPWLALLSTVTLGRPSLALDVLFIGAAPLAGFAAWRASRAFVDNAALRAWIAVSWATMPVLTGAVAGGRFDTCVVVVALPGLLVAGGRLVAGDPAQSGWRRAWTLGLGLAVTSAFSPQVWTGAALLLLGGVGLVVAAGAGDRAAAVRRLRAVGIALAVPAALALPYLTHVLAAPSILLTGLARGAGVGGLVPSATAGPIGLGLLHPGGPGQPPVVLTAPLVLAAILALGRIDIPRRRVAALFWLVGIGGIAAALVISRIHVAGIGTVGRAWPGPAMAIGAAGVLGAAAVSAEHLRVRLAATAFGWRQLVSGALAFACLAAPAVTGIWWMGRGAQGPLHRADDVLLPPDVIADANAAHDPGQRVLVLRRTDAGVHYDLRGLDGPRLGDEELPGNPAARRRIAVAVRDLSTNRGTDAAQVLATFDVRVVVVPGSGRTQLTDALDAQPALARRETPYAAGIWAVEATVPTGRLQLLAPPLATKALAPAAPDAGTGRGPAIADLVANPPQILPSGREAARASVPAGPAGRLLVLAEAANGGWHATVDGHTLPRRTAWGWAQAFVVPAAGGHLVLSRHAAGHHIEIALTVIALLAAVVLAAPSAGSDTETLDDVAFEPEPAPAPPPAPAGSATVRLRRGSHHADGGGPAGPRAGTRRAQADTDGTEEQS